ncbi:AT-rich interactive domain-containing protein 2 isoform X2 [Uranotaenia lowii]|uniref:AT-rich interactive domain-containing protein 2 isoform X2 n=1 Tax=Uranotaenia lowii TaxID=190385 RepID=UPI002478F47B|nr:AT-rich interactive domain-containing protein 2 isoform X2 [Uranotaenia lowii]
MDRVSFLQDLLQFNEKSGTPIVRMPKIGSHDVDLHRLYSTVISRGGWLKVNSREDWDEVIEEMKLPKHCVNNEIALKQIYIRYLDRYERVNFHGEDKDPIEEDDDEKRHNRRWSARMLHAIPAVYNHGQHHVPEGNRAQLSLCGDLYKPSEYEKLMMSLLSPLPNEQDFAINVCTLMSNESKHTLKVDKCPKLISILLGHAGVFSHFTMRDIFQEYYANIRKNSLQRFWKNCLYQNLPVLELSYADCFQKFDRDPTELIKNVYGDGSRKDVDEEDVGKLDSETLMDFLSLGTGLGTNDYIGQRVLQIASIFRNLSFNDENIAVLGSNRAFLRFLIMCANAQWNNLQHMGLDMLGNVASEVDIYDAQSDDVTRCLLSTVQEGLEGEDRGIIIGCLEVLSKIAQRETNEDNLNRYLNQKVYDQICLFLSLRDIMLLLYSLECIYSLTSMGEKPCNAIMHVTGIIDTLVSFITVEAQSYGPDACILMRVVETIPGNLAGFPPGNHVQTGGQVVPPVAPSMTQLTVQPKEQSPVPTPSIPDIPKLPTKATTFHHNVPPSGAPNTIQITSVTRPAASNSPQIPVNIISRNDPNAALASKNLASTSSVQPSSLPSSPATPSGPVTVAAKHAQQQQSQENEQFAYAWLRATFETAPSMNSRIEQHEVYKQYLAANSKIGRKAVMPQVHFQRCVRTVFGGTVGPTMVKGNESNQFFYEGIRLRAKTSATVVNSTAGKTSDGAPSTPVRPLPKPIKPQLAGGGLDSANSSSGQPPRFMTQIINKAVMTNKANVEQQNQFSQANEQKVIILNQTTISPQPGGTSAAAATTSQSQQHQQTTGTTTIMNQSGTITSTTSNPSALIKSLLANKVTTTTTMTTTGGNNEQQYVASSSSSSVGNFVVSSSVASSLSSTTTSTTSLIASNVNVHQVAQRQQMLKQKQRAAVPSSAGKNMVVTSNNPSSIKVGNSTISIKPGTLPSNTVITAASPQESSVDGQLNPPPLAPLSQAGGSMVKTNKMLADLIEKKSGDNSVFAIGETTVKRKSEVDLSEPPSKKIEIMETDDIKVTPKAADLYAELAGSILEGEDFEDIEMKEVKEEVKVQTVSTPQVITMPAPVQRQIIVTPNNPQPVLLSPGGSGGQQLTTQTTATIKTDTGYQTVPIILQQNQLQIQKAAPVLQPAVQQPTQYILATNPQGQTYVVAQQPQQQQQLQQTVLLTQNPQHGTQQKTIIILQQQPNPAGNPQAQTQQIVQTQSPAPQKVFVNQQGQQIIMTQVPRQVQHQGNTISLEGPSQQILKTNQQAQIIQTHIGQQQQQQSSTAQQIQQIIQQSGSQTIQIIPQPPVSAPQSQQLVIQQAQTQPSQVLIQAQQSSQQLKPQIISQQIIQPATQQPQIVQKVIQQKPAQKQSQTSKQSNASATSAQIGSLPTKTIIVQQQTTASGTPQKQIIQVVQQKLSSPHTTPKTVAKPITSQTKSKQEKNSEPASAFLPTTTTPAQTINSPASVPTTVESTKANAEPDSTSTSSTVNAPSPSISPPGTIQPPGPTTIPVVGTNSSIQMIPAMDPAKAIDEDVELSWPWVCDWRGCPRKRYASANEVYLHACAVHCPKSVESTADIYCQWGPGPNLCDNIPRKRFSLMTHIFDRHCTSESFKSAVQRRLSNAASGTQTPQQAYPVSLVRQTTTAGQPTPPTQTGGSTATPVASNGTVPVPAAMSPSSVNGAADSGPPGLALAGPAALHAIKRHAIDWANAKECQDDIEGPVTKSIRLTSALILRNLVVYNNTARRNLRAYEPHLAGVAMNNVESSRTIAQVLFEMNDAQPNY